MARCTACLRKISSLRVQALISLQYFINENGVEKKHSVDQVNPVYKCPECKAALFWDKNSALEFLRSDGNGS